MCAPLVCQTVIAAGVAWNLFFFGSLVLSGLSALLAFYAFRPTASESEGDVNRAVRNAQSQNSSSVTLVQDKESKTTVTVTVTSPKTSEENVGLSELKDAPAPAKSTSSTTTVA